MVQGLLRVYTHERFVKTVEETMAVMVTHERIEGAVKKIAKENAAMVSGGALEAVT